MNREKLGQIVLPTEELLSEMEALQIFGGAGTSGEEDTFNATYCKCAIYSNKCSCTENPISVSKCAPTYNVC